MALRLTQLSFGPAAAPVLERIDLSLEPGHFLGIVGPNGAGKSTLLHLICGLLEPGGGEIRLFGEPLSGGNRRRLLSRLRFLPQRQEGMEGMPVRAHQVVAMGLRENYAPLWRRSGQRERIMNALEQTGTSAWADADFRSLSGGLQQRVRLSRALVSNPRMLLLDEPAAALDAPARQQLYRLLRKLCDEKGMAIIMVEHDIAAISDYVDSVACLNRRIHHHALRGESVPEQIWRDMYGDHIHLVAHDAHCIGCAHDDAGDEANDG